eukprot:jgi/Bigna1/131572/aug1.14_g6280
MAQMGRGHRYLLGDPEVAAAAAPSTASGGGAAVAFTNNVSAPDYAAVAVEEPVINTTEKGPSPLLPLSSSSAAKGVEDRDDLAHGDRGTGGGTERKEDGDHDHRHKNYPILDQWLMLPDSRYVGRVYGGSMKNGTALRTSRVLWTSGDVIHTTKVSCKNGRKDATKKESTITFYRF